LLLQSEFLSQFGTLGLMTRVWGENATPIAEVRPTHKQQSHDLEHLHRLNRT
jgi:hypothetical protein